LTPTAPFKSPCRRAQSAVVTNNADVGDNSSSHRNALAESAQAQARTQECRED
jgi:hypothetical protein